MHLCTASAKRESANKEYSLVKKLLLTAYGTLNEMNQPFSVNELIDNLGKTVQSTIELVAKTSPLDIRTVEMAVESGLDKIKDRLASDFELVKKTEYETNVELLDVLKKQVDALEERIAELEKESRT